jgi:hypothetical protein
VERGARVFRRWGTAAFKFATASTLEMYTESSIAKPLSLSGGYTGNRAHHRQLETVRFWIDVSDPGGLDPGGAGRATAMQVRVMHVFIRRRLMQHPEWDLDAWGAPISVADATLTLMGGSVVPGLSLWTAGHQTTVTEIEALLHFWRYIGHLLGVQPDWYPRDFRESVQLMFAAFVKRAYAAGADGDELIESYLPAFAPKPDPDAALRKRLRDHVQYRALIGYTRFWMLPQSYKAHDAAADRRTARPARRSPSAQATRGLVPQSDGRAPRRVPARRTVPPLSVGRGATCRTNRRSEANAQCGSPRTGRPGRASAHSSPSRTTNSPATSSCRTPDDGRHGST